MIGTIKAATTPPAKTVIIEVQTAVDDTDIQGDRRMDKTGDKTGNNTELSGNRRQCCRKQEGQNG